MLIHWPKLIAALVLLFIPIGVFHGEKVRYRPVSRDWDRHWQQILGLGLHTIDFARAVLGAWLLVDALGIAPGAKGIMRYSVLLTHAAVLWLAALLQTAVCKELDSLHAPFAFATGLVLGFAPLDVGGFAVLLAAIIALGARKPGAYFPALAILLFGTGFLFGGKRMLLSASVVAAAVVLPSFIGILFRRRMVISYRARRSSDPTRAPFAGAANT